MLIKKTIVKSIHDYCPRREPPRGWLTTMRPETTNWTRPGTEVFLVREMRKGLLSFHYFDNRLDPDG